MNPYDKYRQSEHLQRQAVDRFGQASEQAARMRSVMDYWFEQWATEDCCKVVAPPADILEARIKDEEKIIKRRER